MLTKTLLGNTGIKVSRLGLGTVKIGRDQQVKYPHKFTIPSDKQVKELLAIARDNGINLLDTAPSYGTSEERLGKLLLGQRQDWVISTKVGEEFVAGKSYFDFSQKHMISSIERSLRRFATDYLDVVLVHSTGDDVRILEEHQVFATLEQLKSKGMIRAFGMSTKTVAGGVATIEQADVAMVTYNPLHTEEKAVLDRAQELNKGILIKKAFASGHLDQIKGNNPVEQAFEFVCKHQAVSSVVVGTINPQHLQQNAAIF